MKKETFIGIMKECIKHAEGSEKMGEAMKDLVSTRSSLTDFMDGFDTIFYDDQMVESILRLLEKELGDKDELIVQWFYEYRIMNLGNQIMQVTFGDEHASVTFNIGTEPEEDDENLSILYDVVTRN